MGVEMENTGMGGYSAKQEKNSLPSLRRAQNRLASLDEHKGRKHLVLQLNPLTQVLDTRCLAVAA